MGFLPLNLTRYLASLIRYRFPFLPVLCAFFLVFLLLIRIVLSMKPVNLCNSGVQYEKVFHHCAQSPATLLCEERGTLEIHVIRNGGNLEQGTAGELIDFSPSCKENSFSLTLSIKAEDPFHRSSIRSLTLKPQVLQIV